MILKAWIYANGRNSVNKYGNRDTKSKPKQKQDKTEKVPNFNGKQHRVLKYGIN